MSAQLFTTPGHPAAFSGVSRVKEHSRGRTYDSVERDLEQLDSFTRQRQKSRPRTYNPFLIHAPREQIQMDLIDISALWRQNKGVRFLLVAIDCFTRKAAVVGIRKKSAEKTLEAIKIVLETQLPPLPKSVVFDRGSEFMNAKVREYLQNLGVKQFNPTGFHKAALAERFNRSLQSLIYKYLTDRNSKRYIDVLPALVQTYNSRKHRSIGMSPNEAELEHNHARVREILGVHHGEALKQRRKPRYAVGDRVRIKEHRLNPKNFRRGYKQQFSSDIYKIYEVKTNLPIVMYKVESEDGRKLRPSFYDSELQRVST